MKNKVLILITMAFILNANEFNIDAILEESKKDVANNKNELNELKEFVEASKESATEAQEDFYSKYQSSSSTSSTIDYVMVEFDVTCGLLKSCIEQNLNISGAGGTGNFSSGFNGASTGAIHKGYDGKIVGRYSWSAEFKNFDKVYSCSGSFYISGNKRNYAIRVYDNCSDAGSGEY